MFAQAPPPSPLELGEAPIGGGLFYLLILGIGYSLNSLYPSKKKLNSRKQ
jgi:hypothetical protein